MEKITIETTIHAPIEKVWEYYNTPEHVTKWNHASNDWHSPRAENDLRVGGKFNYRMEAIDGSEGFDFEGEYTEVIENEVVSYTIGDRSVTVLFSGHGDHSHIEVTFDAEDENSLELQRNGWQAILDNFTNYVENN